MRLLRQHIRTVLKEEVADTEYAVIEVIKPSSRMPLKWYFQTVPLEKTKQDKIQVKRGSAGTITISTKNIKIHKKFKKSEAEEMDKYLENLRNEYKNGGEQTESELTEKCWKGYTQKGMKTMFGKRYPNCVKKSSLNENIEDYIEKMVEKNYDFSFDYKKKNVRGLDVLIVSLELIPKSDLAKNIPKKYEIIYHSSWEWWTNRWVNSDSNTAYNQGGIFKQMGLTSELNRFLYRKSKEFVNRFVP